MLIVSTVTIGVVHALAPDHWVPFVSIGRAQQWSKTKLVGVTLVSGIAHVGSSVFIGAIGLLLGFSLTGLEAVESQRAEVAGLLLIGFGLAYAVWGLKHMRRHRHRPVDPKRAVTIWALVAIFVLGPCEPLIPLMFVSAAHGWEAVFVVSGLFGLITLGMMVGQALLVYIGIDFFKITRINHHVGHVIAGLVIAGTGLMVMFLGI
ncbi:MAG: hypothetical protein ACE5G0_04755 [Rhodothermales bacterium]